MPDHLHILLTAATDQSLERCIQFIKGGFSFAVRAAIQGDLWQAGHHEHRVRDIEDFEKQLGYIACNPTRKHYVDYRYVHTNFGEQLDERPEYLRG